ncbi:hypothetical protein PRIPAC_71319, partial [Pristionchus pacificus]
NQWKLMHIFIGGNDVCGWDSIRKGIQFMKENMPKTIVVLTGMIDVLLLRTKIDNAKEVCKEIHTFECKVQVRAKCDYHRCNAEWYMP